MSELSGLPGSEGYEVCDDEGWEPTWIERRTPNQNHINKRNDSLRESKFKSYQDLSLTLTAPQRNSSV